MTKDSQTEIDAKANATEPNDDEETVTHGYDTASPPKPENDVSELPTLREFFGLPEQASDHGDDLWKAFQDKLAEETRGIKWTATMPDLGSRICELLDIKIHDVLLTAWKKVEAVRQAIEDSKQNPEKASYLDLTEHNVDYETKPFIDVKIKRASVKKLTLTVAVNLKVKGFGLKVQNGAIREMQTGKCEGKGTIKYEKLAIAEKKFEPIKFPPSIEIPALITIPEPAAKPPTVKASPVRETKVGTKADHPVERIEL